MKFVLKSIIFLFFAFFCFNLKAQTPSKAHFSNVGLSYSVHVGKVVPHRSYFRPQVSGASFIHEWSYTKQTDANSEWAGLYNYPLTGISLSYIELSNRAVFGQAVGILPFINFQKRHRLLCYNFKIGVGFAYFSKTFNERNNYTNNAIGGHFTNYTHLAFGLNRQISSRFSLDVDFSLNHFSNGNTEQPNLGINILAAKLGVTYWLNSAPIEFKKLSSKAIEKWRFSLLGGLGFGSIVVNGGPNYAVGVGSLFLERKHLLKSAFSIGLDYEYHQSVRRFLVIREFEGGKLWQNSSKASILLGYNFVFPHLSYHFQIGTYLYNPQLKKEGAVVKLNAYYHFKNQYKPQNFNPFVGLCLKSHYFSADFVQLMIGVGF